MNEEGVEIPVEKTSEEGKETYNRICSGKVSRKVQLGQIYEIKCSYRKYRE